ncbi:hypothetical protein BKA93DRAFT_12016 [Sparassis latifolia]
MNCHDKVTPTFSRGCAHHAHRYRKKARPRRRLRCPWMKFPGIGGEHTEACAPVDGGRLRYVRRRLPLLVASSNGDAGWYLSTIAGAGQSTTQNKMQKRCDVCLDRLITTVRLLTAGERQLRRWYTCLPRYRLLAMQYHTNATLPAMMYGRYRLTTLTPELPCAPLLISWTGNRWKEDVLSTPLRCSSTNAECTCGTSSVGSN